MTVQLWSKWISDMEVMRNSTLSATYPLALNEMGNRFACKFGKICFTNCMLQQVQEPKTDNPSIIKQ